MLHLMHFTLIAALVSLTSGVAQDSEDLKQPVVVETRPGATGTIGAEAVVRAPSDGYTLLSTKKIANDIAKWRDFTSAANIHAD